VLAVALANKLTRMAWRPQLKIIDYCRKMGSESSPSRLCIMTILPPNPASVRINAGQGPALMFGPLLTQRKTLSCFWRTLRPRIGCLKAGCGRSTDALLLSMPRQAAAVSAKMGKGN
jgi:hypothetical protein